MLFTLFRARLSPAEGTKGLLLHTPFSRFEKKDDCHGNTGK